MLVLFENDEARLLLNSIKRDSEGKLRSGFVVNGAWNFEIRKDEVLAKTGSSIVNRWCLPDYFEMEIPKDIKGDYNFIMSWAKENYKEKYLLSANLQSVAPVQRYTGTGSDYLDCVLGVGGFEQYGPIKGVKGLTEHE